MTDASDSAPSKRADEIAEQTYVVAARMNVVGSLINASGMRILDAELRKEREAERERCARAIEQFAAASYPLYKDDLLREAAAAIRAGAPPAPDRAEAEEGTGDYIEPHSRETLHVVSKARAEAGEELAKAVEAYRDNNDGEDYGPYMKMMGALAAYRALSPVGECEPPDDSMYELVRDLGLPR